MRRFLPFGVLLLVPLCTPAPSPVSAAPYLEPVFGPVTEITEPAELESTGRVLLDTWQSTQRYFVYVPKGGPLTYDSSDPSVAMVLTRKPGERFYGIPEGGATPEDKSWPDAKGDVGIVTGLRPGTCTVTAWGVKGDQAVKVETWSVTVRENAVAVTRSAPAAVPPPPTVQPLTDVSASVVPSMPFGYNPGAMDACPSGRCAPQRVGFRRRN